MRFFLKIENDLFIYDVLPRPLYLIASIGDILLAIFAGFLLLTQIVSKT